LDKIFWKDQTKQILLFGVGCGAIVALFGYFTKENSELSNLKAAGYGFAYAGAAGLGLKSTLSVPNLIRYYW
jgi:Na+/proline symporter